MSLPTDPPETLSINTIVNPLQTLDFDLEQPLIHVTWKNPEDYANLMGATLESDGTTIANHTGLSAVYDTALRIVTSDFATEKLVASFSGVTKGDESVTQDVIRDVFGHGVQILLADDTAKDVRGYHVPYGETTGSLRLANNHVFLSGEDVKQLLPTTPRPLWGEKEMNGVFVMAWWLVHELSHMCASVLYELGLITDLNTPTNFVPFGDFLYGKLIWTMTGT